MVAALGAAGLMSTAAPAATTTDQFDVIINLTAACEITSLPDVTLNYTSFQTIASTGNTTAAIRCSNGLTYNLSLDSLAVTDAILNLDYTLTFPGGTGPFTGTGNVVGVNHQIDVSIGPNQGGTCAATPPATCSNAGAGANRTRTLTVTF